MIGRDWLRWALVACAFGPGLASWWLPPGSAADRAVLLVGAGSGAALLLLVALLRGNRIGATAPSLKTVFAVAVVVRLLVVAGPLRLDDDIHRYIWDGSVSAAGVSPYRFAPLEVLEFDPEFDRILIDDPVEYQQLELLSRLPPAHSGTLEAVNFPQYPTLYPPTSQLVFAVLPTSERAFRCAFAALDIVVVALLVTLLRHFGRPTWWVIGYAWNPLVVLESGAAGHQDVIGIVALLAALAALWQRRSAMLAAMLTLATTVKVFPAALFMVWWRHLDFRALFAALATVATISLPFALLGPISPDGMSIYLQRWEFFSGPFAPLRTLLGDSGARAAVAIATFCLIVFLARTGGRRHVAVRNAMLLVEVMVVISPVVDPWYVPWALALAVLRGSFAWLLFAWLVPLAYLDAPAAGHAWQLRAAVWLPFLSLLIWEWRTSFQQLGRPTSFEPEAAPKLSR